MRTVVVSPHLDDAVLSLAGWIAGRAGEVVVMTVCSEGDDGYAARRAEDVAAALLLGARAVHLGVPDAPFRGYARSFRGLVLAEAGEADAARLRDAVVAGVRAVAAEAVLLPLGVGEHVDHRIVHGAHAGIVGRVGFYEDRPYADIKHATRARLGRLGACVDGASIVPAPASVAEFLASARAAAHVRAYLPADEREACLRPLARGLVEASPSRLALTCEAWGVEPATRSRAARAVGAYASQVGDLFGGAEAAEAAYLAADSVRVYWRSP